MFTADSCVIWLSGRNLLLPDLKKMAFLLSNTWLSKVINLLQLTFLVKNKVSSLNETLKKRYNAVVFFHDMVSLLRDSSKTYDLSKTIEEINLEIEGFIHLREQFIEILDKINETTFTKSVFPEIAVSAQFISKIIDTEYDILRTFKKINTRIPIPATQLAIDTAAHSASTLSSLINGD